MSMRLVARAALTAALVASGAPARAQTPEQQEPEMDDDRTRAARDLFLAAVEAARSGDWHGAAELYARSYALRPAATTLYSLAVAQRETGDLVKALESFRAFLALEPSPQAEPFREPAEAAAAELEGRIARVSVVVKPRAAAGLAVELDGVPVEPETVRLANPGMHTVEASAPGYRPAVLPVRLASGAREEVVIALDPILIPAPVDRAQETPPREAPIAALVALGVGSAVLSVGVTTGVVGVWMASRAETEDEGDRSRRVAIAGDVMAATGGVAAGLGLAFLIAHLASDGGQSGGTAVSSTPMGLQIAF